VIWYENAVPAVALVLVRLVIAGGIVLEAEVVAETELD
jgi:hypothetical protein